MLLIGLRCLCKMEGCIGCYGTGGGNPYGMNSSTMHLFLAWRRGARYIRSDCIAPHMHGKMPKQRAVARVAADGLPAQSYTAKPHRAVLS